MKLNWGVGIVLALAGFIAFIMYFFIKGHFVQQVNLVTEDYYDQGLKHEERVEWKQNAQTLMPHIPLSKEGGEVVAEWPQGWGEATEGTIHFYRPNNNRYDFEEEIAIDQEGSQRIASDKFIPGNYRVKIRATNQGATYYWEESFTY